MSKSDNLNVPEFPDPFDLIESPTGIGDKASASLPVHVLPKVLREAVEDISNDFLVDPAIPYSGYMAVISGIISPYVTVEVRSEWVEPTLLYLLVNAPSGEAKSPGMKRPQALLKQIDRQFSQKVRVDIERARFQHRQLTVRLEQLEKAATDNDGLDTVEADKLFTELAFLKDGTESAQRVANQKRTLIFADATPEALVEHRYRLVKATPICLDPEGSLLNNALGTYGGKPSLNFILTAWDNGPYPVNRKNMKEDYDGSFILERTQIAMALAVQPLVAERAMQNDEIRERGVIARFLVSVPKPIFSTRLISGVATGDSRVTSERLHKMVLSMFSSLTKDRELSLGDKAREAYEMWHDSLTKFDNDEDRPYVAKIRGFVPRIAALFHMVDGVADDKIGFDHLEAAIKLGDFHLHEALRLKSDLRLNNVMYQAMDYLVAHGPSGGKTARDVYNDLGYRAKGQPIIVKEALEELAGLGWIAPDNGQPFDKRPTVGVASPIILLHPRAKELLPPKDKR